jgi:Myb/SANT-like DNA-binding domain
VSAAAKTRGWGDLALELSAVSGIKRSGDEIKKKWSSLKSGAKTEAVLVKKSIACTGGGQSSVAVDNNQQRILGVMGAVCVNGVMGGIDTAETGNVLLSFWFCGLLISVYSIIISVVTIIESKSKITWRLCIQFIFVCSDCICHCL